MTCKDLYDVGLECPINNGADIVSDFLLDELFDYHEYVERKIGHKHIVLGFIGVEPAKVEYEIDSNWLTIHSILPKEECDYDIWKKLIPERMPVDVIPKVVEQGDGHVKYAFFHFPEDDK